MKTKFTEESIKSAIGNTYKSLEAIVGNLLSETDFTVEDISIGSCCTSIKLVIQPEDDKARWNELDLVLEEDPFEFDGKEQFRTNIGTTGAFSLDDTSKGSRANFYIQVGKVLGNSDLLGAIKNAMIIHEGNVRELRKQWQELKKKEA